MENKEKIAIINGSVYSNFNNCPLFWHFCWYESSQKIEKIPKRYLRLVLDDYERDYGHLITKNGTTTMEIKVSRTLATEICKTIISTLHIWRIFSLQKQTQKYDHII